MITAHHLVFGRQYRGLFKIPFGICNRYRFNISTRSGNLVIKMPDGEIINYNTPKSQDYTLVSGGSSVVRNYATPFPAQDVYVVTNNGNNDVYSFLFDWTSVQYSDNYNIQNIADFLAQFPNLYSIHYNIYAYGDNAQRPTIKGNLFAFPKSVTRVKITNLDVLNRPNDTYGNFDSFTNDMQLTYFNDVEAVVSGGSKYYGNLAKTPPNVNFLKITATNNSTLTYTSGKVWASSFDTLDIGNAKLSVTDTDNLLIDMNNSITTAIGGKVINLVNCPRTYVSNTAVTSLQSKGFTVTTGSVFTPFEITFDLGQNVTINGTVTRAEGHDGRLNAIQFGSGNLVSADPLPASPVWSFAFWLKTSTTTANSNVVEIGDTADNKNGLIVRMNQFATGRMIGVIASTSNQYNIYGNNGYNDGQWHHIVVILDRSQATANEIVIYRDKVLQTLTSNVTFNSTGDFISDKLYIGGRISGSPLQRLDGVISPIKAFNYPLSQTEINNLYNE